MNNQPDTDRTHTFASDRQYCTVDALHCSTLCDAITILPVLALGPLQRAFATPHALTHITHKTLDCCLAAFTHRHGFGGMGEDQVDIPLTSMPSDCDEAQGGPDRAAGSGGGGGNGCQSGTGTSVGSVGAVGLGGRGRVIHCCLNRCKI